MSVPASRFRALLCTGLFLVGALGFPLTDAALFHRAGHDPFAGVVHVEPQGNAHHGDRCALARPIAPTASGISSFDAIQAAPPVECRATLLPPVEPRSADTPSSHRTRAPPA